MRRFGKVCSAIIIAFAAFMAVTWFYPLSAFNPIWLVIWGSGYEAALRNGPAEIGPVGEIVELFPQAQHTISYYTGQAGQPSWTSSVGLHGRYILSVQLDVEFDWSRRHIRSHGAPRYYPREVGVVELLPDGRAVISYVVSSQRDFWREGWDALSRSGGDLGALGIRVVRDDPVAHFERAWVP